MFKIELLPLIHPWNSTLVCSDTVTHFSGDDLTRFFFLMRTILEEMSVKIHKVKKIASHDKSRAGKSFSFISILGSWLTLWEYFFFPSPVSFKIREISHNYLCCFSCFSQIYNFLQSTIRNYLTWIFKISLKY